MLSSKSVQNFIEGVGSGMSIKKAILIYCIDPRFEKITRKAIEKELGCQIELIFTWPGGWPMMPDELKNALIEHLKNSLKIDNSYIVVLVAHEECGAYWLFRHLRGQEALNMQTGDLSVEKFMLGMRVKNTDVYTFTLCKSDDSNVKLLSRNYPFLDFHEVEDIVMVPASNWKESIHFLRSEMNIRKYDLFVYFEEGLMSFRHQFIQEKYIFQFNEVSIKAHHASNIIIFRKELCDFSLEEILKNKIDIKIKEVFLPSNQLVKI